VQQISLNLCQAYCQRFHAVGRRRTAVACRLRTGMGRTASVASAGHPSARTTASDVLADDDARASWRRMQSVVPFGLTQTVAERAVRSLLSIINADRAMFRSMHKDEKTPNDSDRFDPRTDRRSALGAPLTTRSAAQQDAVQVTIRTAWSMRSASVGRRGIYRSS
jgi:hypothetical protein